MTCTTEEKTFMVTGFLKVWKNEMNLQKETTVPVHAGRTCEEGGLVSDSPEGCSWPPSPLGVYLGHQRVAQVICPLFLHVGQSSVQQETSIGERRPCTTGCPCLLCTSADTRSQWEIFYKELQLYWPRVDIFFRPIFPKQYSAKAVSIVLTFIRCYK